MDIAMTKGFAASPKPFVGSRSDDDYQANDKEILEIIKSANLNAKTLKSLIYNFSENTPKDILSEEDREIFSYIKTEKLDLQKLKSLYQNSTITNQKTKDLESIEGTYKNFPQTSKNNDISEEDKKILQLIKKENLDFKKLDNIIQDSKPKTSKEKSKDLKKDPRPIVQKILAFMEKEKIDIREMEKRAGLSRSSLSVFLYSGLSNNIKISRLVKITNLMNISLDEFILDNSVPISRKRNITNEEIEQSIKEKVLNFLKENNLSIRDLERDISKDTVFNLFKQNGTKIPNLNSLIAIAKIMNHSLESFLPQ